MSCLIASAALAAAQSPGPTLRGPVPNPAFFQSPDFGHAITTIPDATGGTNAIVTTGDYFSGSTSESTINLYEPDGTLRWQRLPPAEFFGYFGSTYAGLPDIDGDLVPDLLVGRSFDDAAELLSGATGARIELLSSPTPLLGSSFGTRVASMGDMDGDGAVEFTVEGSTGLALYRFVGGSSQFVTFHPGISAAALPGPGGVTEMITDSSFDARFYTLSGSSLTLQRSFPQRPHRTLSVGDVTGDGREDLLMNTGIDVSLLDGASLGVVWFKDGAGLTLSTGFSAEGFFGASLAGGMDLNGNGTLDVAIGDIYHMASHPESGEGAVFFYEGTTGAEIGRLFGIAQFSGMGNTIALASTFLGNGLPTLLSGQNTPYGYAFPTTIPGEIRGYTLQPPGVAPPAAPVLQVDRVYNNYVVSGANPNSLGLIGASLATTTFAGMTVVDIFSPALLVVAPLPFDANGIAQAGLPTLGFPPFYLQVMDDRGILTEVTSWDFY
ncbi:MAG: hypothetical protein P1V81_12790 [Planctomycetota bacterium]|nr:hypothetical protein [Planctomycetota bacterium]